MVERACIDSLRVFSGLDDVEQEAVARLAIRHEYVSGDVLFHAGDPRDTFYVIERGDIRLVSSFYGREQTIVVYHTGAFIALPATFADRTSHRSTAEVVSVSGVMLEISHVAWEGLVQEHPAIVGNLLRTAAATLDDRLVYANRKLFTLYAVSRILRVAKNIERAAHDILPVALSATSAERGLVVTKDAVLKRLVSNAVLGYEQPERITAWAGRFETDAYVGAVVSSRESRIVTTPPPKFSPPYATASMLLVPLVIATQCIGALVLADRSVGRSFAQNSLMLVETIAQQVADAFERGRLTLEQEEAVKFRRTYIAPYSA